MSTSDVDVISNADQEDSPNASATNPLRESALGQPQAEKAAAQHGTGGHAIDVAARRACAWARLDR
jgi:hypothetical protein